MDRLSSTGLSSIQNIRELEVKQSFSGGVTSKMSKPQSQAWAKEPNLQQFRVQNFILDYLTHTAAQVTSTKVRVILSKSLLYVFSKIYVIRNLQ